MEESDTMTDEMNSQFVWDFSTDIGIVVVTEAR